MKRKRKGYWILSITEFCPVCGAENSWKERIFNRSKPKDPAKRYESRQEYDQCLEKEGYY